MAKGKSPAEVRDVHRSSNSPARQLQLDLERSFSNLQVHENERQKLYTFSRKFAQDELDAKEYAQAVVHQSEIESAIAQHEAVRKQAIAVLEAHIRDEQERRRQREEEEQRKQEEVARRKAEEQRRLREEHDKRVREEAEATKRAADEKARKAEQRRIRDQEQQEAARRKDEDEATARRDAEHQTNQREQQEKRENAQREQAQRNEQTVPLPATTKPLQAKPQQLSGNEHPWSSNPEIRHKQYLDIHQKLKVFRREFWESAKKDKQFKASTGEKRRAMKAAVGQLTTGDRAANTVAVRKVKETLLSALNDTSSPPVVLNDYLPAHLSLLDKNTTRIPSLLLYLVSMFSKAVISAFVNECAVNVKGAEPIGTMVAQIFSLDELQFQRNAPSPNSGLHYEAFGGHVPTPPMQPTSVSLITILMCKFHATAPILFGISGDERTASGKKRLGWRLQGETTKSFAQESVHYDRLTGLGAGFASIALRNFSKSPKTNPYPPLLFWESLARVLNTEPGRVQVSHLIVLKSMLENSVDRFVLFFGAPGVAALRQAVIEFPRSLPRELQQSSAAKGLMLLAETWKEELKLDLSR